MRSLHNLAVSAASLLVLLIAFAGFLAWRDGVQDCGVSRAEREFEPNPILVACAYAGMAPAQARLGMLMWADAAGDPPSQRFPRWSKLELERRGRTWLESAAERGNAVAQNEMGLAHLEGGYSVPRDYNRARFWLETATRGGDEIAPLNLARMYYRGEGVPRSEVQAEAMLRLSAQRGYFDGRCSLAALLERRGIAANCTEIEFLRQIAGRAWIPTQVRRS